MAIVAVSSRAAEPAVTARAVTAPDGTRYVIMQVYEKQGALELFYPVVARLRPDSSIDDSFANKGFYSFKNLDGWSEVEMNDIQFDGHGNIFLLGRVASPPPKPPRPKLRLEAGPEEVAKELTTFVRAVQEEGGLPFPQSLARELPEKVFRKPKLVDVLAALKVISTPYRAKEATVKLFVTKLDHSGHCDEHYGEIQGTAFVPNVLNRYGDKPEKLALGEDGAAYYGAELKDVDDKNNLVFGKLNPHGIIDVGFGDRLTHTTGIPTGIRDVLDDRPSGSIKDLRVEDDQLKAIVFAEKGMGTEKQTFLYAEGAAPSHENSRGIMEFRGVTRTHFRSVNGKKAYFHLESKVALSPDGTEMTVVTWDGDRSGTLTISKYDRTTGKRLVRATSQQHPSLRYDDIEEIRYHDNGSLELIGMSKDDPNHLLTTSLTDDLHPAKRLTYISDFYDLQGPCGPELINAFLSLTK